MRIPINQIQENKYTNGDEFVEKLSYKPYKGNYYSTGNQFFSGKSFNPNAIEIVKISSSTSKVSSLDNNVLSYFFNSSSETKQSISNQIEIKGIHFTPSQKNIDDGYAMRYFIKKQNDNPIIIKEINEEDYNNINNPIYVKVILIWELSGGFNQTDIDSLDKSTMKGLKDFLSV